MIGFTILCGILCYSLFKYIEYLENYKFENAKREKELLLLKQKRESEIKQKVKSIFGEKINYLDNNFIIEVQSIGNSILYDKHYIPYLWKKIKITNISGYPSYLI